MLFLSPQLRADDALEGRASWQTYDATEMARMLRGSLDDLGVVPTDMDQVTDDFLGAIEKQDSDPLDAYVEALRGLFPSSRNWSASRR